MASIPLPQLRETQRQHECPHRRHGACDLVSQELGFSINMPIDDCDRCFAAGPANESPSAGVRTKHLEAVVSRLSKPEALRLLNPAAAAKITARMASVERDKARKYLKGIERCGCSDDTESPFKHFFGRVICINLLRRADRWARFYSQLPECWPFRPIERFRATDGNCVSGPLGWTDGAGTWGCRMSHIRALEEQASTEMAGVPWLILEDDAWFPPDFAAKAEAFLSSLPSDWEGIMLGGQHNKHEFPVAVNPHVVRIKDAGRTHAYAVRGRGLTKFLEALLSWKPGDTLTHADYVLSVLHSQTKWYGPRKWLVYQDAGTSDINGGKHPRKSWNLPEASTPVVYIGEAVKEVPGHRGFTLDAQGVDMGLLDIFVNQMLTPKEQVERLKKWLRMIDWEAASMDTHPTIYTAGRFQIPDNLLQMVARTRIRKETPS